METKLALAKALKSCRKAKGLTQEDFGVVSSRTYLSSLERGLKSPTIEKVEVLAEKMGINPLTILMLTYMNASENDDLESLYEKVRQELESLRLGD